MCSNWFEVIDKISKKDREYRSIRIQEFTKLPPQIELTIEKDDYSRKVGLWRVPGGIVRIDANRYGQYDPNDQFFIVEEEVEAMTKVSQLPNYKGSDQ